MHKGIKRLIWVYLILLIFEGALRKWMFPGQADLLLIIRDPVVLGIYLLAFVGGVFPINGFIIAVAALAAGSVAASLIAGQHNWIVMLYGLRINYLHLPLIWIMATLLDRRDVQRLGTFLLLVALPMTLIMIMQFRAPMNAPINRGVGGTDIGQIFGAEGRIRPPGLFAFITGPQLFLPLAAAFFFYQAGTRRQLPWWLLLATGVAVAIALPVSISRTAVIATGLVAATFGFTLFFGAGRGGSLVRTLFILGTLIVSLYYLPVFHEGRDVFLSRWDTAAQQGGGNAWESISDRIFGGLLRPLHTMARAPLFGRGIGVGSNVGAKLLSGSVGFLLAEDEWNKVILELGPLVGGAFLLWRIGLTVYLGVVALQAFWRQREPLPLLIFSATGAAVLIYQWGPPTILGFAVFGAGLILAALKEPAVESETEPESEFVSAAPPVLQPLPAASIYRPSVGRKLFPT